MLVLAIDTSSAAVTAGLFAVTAEGIESRAERVVINARGHGELLAPGIAAGLDEAGVAPADLAAIVAGTGPGPYTGLRVGLVTAAVMGDALGIPTYGVCSLDAIATPSDGELIVAADARRKEVYWARYDRDGQRLDGPHVDRAADVPIGEAIATAGAGAKLYDFGLPVRDTDYPSAVRLVERAADRVRAKAPSETLTPLYLRRPDAVANPTVKPVTP